jgi:hypothetical protein
MFFECPKGYLVKHHLGSNGNRPFRELAAPSITATIQQRAVGKASGFYDYEPDTLPQKESDLMVNLEGGKLHMQEATKSPINRIARDRKLNF